MFHALQTAALGGELQGLDLSNEMAASQSMTENDTLRRAVAYPLLGALKSLLPRGQILTRSSMMSDVF